MRGDENTQQTLFSTINPEDRIPKNHPLRPIRTLVNEILRGLSGKFDDLYSSIGRPSIAPEYLLRASILQILFTIRSERQLMEQIEFNILFRWFVGIGLDDDVWDHSTFTKNRNRLLNTEISALFFSRVVEHARKKKLLSSEHFTVDGTLIEAWASMKSFQKKEDSKDDNKPNEGGRNSEVDFHGEKRSNETHESKTDPQARLYKKSSGSEAKLCFMGHVLMENRNGLAIDAMVTSATGTAEREAALEMLERTKRGSRCTLGADKGYDVKSFADSLREGSTTPHIAAKRKQSCVDGRTIRHKGYEISQRIRKRIEEIFGWSKTVGLIRKVKFRGLKRIEALFTFCISVFNLVKIRNIEAMT